MPRPSLERQYNQEVTRLRERLRGTNLTNLEAASHVSRATLSRLRQGRHIPEPATIDAIWAGLDKLDEAEREAP